MAAELEKSAEEIHDNNGNVNEPISEPDPDLSDGKEDVENYKMSLSYSLITTEIDAPGTTSRRRSAKSEVFKEIMNAPGLSVHYALEKWVEEEKELSSQEIAVAMIDFCWRQIMGQHCK